MPTVTAYRTPEAATDEHEAGSARRTSRPPRSTPSTDPVTAARKRLMLEMIAARQRRVRASVVQIVVGLGLAIAGGIVTAISHGQFIWFGAVFAGVLTAIRGGSVLIQLHFGSSTADVERSL